MQSSQTLRRTLPRWALLTAALIPPALAAQAVQRQAPVEVTTPKPPTPVMADGKNMLGYELHVTNFGSRPLALKSVEVFSSLTATQPIAMRRDSSLRAAFQIGARMQMSDARETHGSSAGEALRIDAGERAVVFLWLTLAPTERMPTLLRHRLTFAPLDSGGRPSSAVSSVIDSLITPVNDGRVAAIATPMRGGDWLAGEGPSNSSDHRRSLIPLNGKAWISQRFAIDWVKIGPNGNTFHDNRSRNENFWGFGEPVLAVADGEVIAVTDSIADNMPGMLPTTSTIANLSGNHVILRIDKSRYVMYAHLKHGSVRVHVGQRVKTGDVLGLLGNSGQATAPHLHFQVTDAPSDIAAEGIPFTFDQFTFLGYGKDYEPDKPHLSIVKRHELPVDDAVVHFPGPAGR
jgi:peptidase M23-like protein